MWSALNSAITKMLIYKKISLKASQKVKNMHNKCFFDPTGSELGSKYLVTRYKYRHQLQHIYSKKTTASASFQCRNCVFETIWDVQLRYGTLGELYRFTINTFMT